MASTIGVPGIEGPTDPRNTVKIRDGSNRCNRSSTYVESGEMVSMPEVFVLRHCQSVEWSTGWEGVFPE